MTAEPTVQDATANKRDGSAADGVQGDHAGQQECEHHEGRVALTVAGRLGPGFVPDGSIDRQNGVVDDAPELLVRDAARQNRYAILYRISTAKRAATRERRIIQFIQMLARGETIHPQKRT